MNTQQEALDTAAEKDNAIDQGPLKKEQGKPPGRGSIMWDTLTDMNNGPLLPSIAIMQSATPAVGTAVNKYALYKYDTLGRAIRTNWSLIRFLYDGSDVAQKESEALRNLHANIKGTHEDGSKYFALNPLTFRIVPDTFLDGVIRIREDLGKPLTKEERDQLYEEYVGLCLLFGIPRKYIEPTIDDFYVYYENLMRTGMTYNDTVKFLIGDVPTKPPKLPGPFKLFQKRFNKRYEEKVRPRNRIFYVGALHPIYRETMGIKWSKEDEVEYRRLCAKLGEKSKKSTRFLRTNPTAYLLMMGYRGPKLVTMEHLKEAEEKLKRIKEKKQAKAEANL